MTRFFNFAAAALVCGFVYLLAAGIAVPEAATDRTMFVVSAVALLGSILAIAFAVTAGLPRHGHAPPPGPGGSRHARNRP